MKKIIPIIIGLVLIIGAAGGGFAAYYHIQRPDIDKNIREICESKEYDTLFISQFPTDNLDFELYDTYFNEKVVGVTHKNCSDKRLAEHINTALEYKNDIKKIYVGVDYLKMEDMTLITDVIEANSDIDWDIVVSAAFIDDIKKCDYDAKISCIKKMLEKFRVYDNVRITAPIFDTGIVFNPNNFDENGLVANLGICYVLNEYKITDGNIFFKSKKLTEFIDTFDVNSYPDFSDKTIVFFGDSIIANAGENDSIPTVTKYLSKAETISYCIGGTYGAKLSDNDEQSFSFQLDKCLAEHPSFDKSVIFIINFGINDFLLSHQSMGDGEDSYSGGLTAGIERLKNAYPGCEIIVCAPTYYDHYLGEELTFGTEVLNDYRYAAKVTAENNNCKFLNNYEDLGINHDNFEEYLDGEVHLNVDGRFLYADNLLKRMREWYGR